MFLSGELVPFRNRTFTLTPTYSTQPTKQLSIEGKTQLSCSTMQSSTMPGVHTSSMDSHININVFPSPALKFQWSHSLFSSYRPERSSIYFMNLSSRYSFRKFDLELCINNILNNRLHQHTYLNSMTEYTLQQHFRAREILLKVSFCY